MFGLIVSLTTKETTFLLFQVLFKESSLGQATLKSKPSPRATLDMLHRGWQERQKNCKEW